MNTRFAALTVQLLLAVALSSSLAFASGEDEEPAKPECPKGQVWDSKQQKCLKQTNSLVSDADRTDYAYRLAKDGRYEESICGSTTCEKYQDLAEAINGSPKT